MYRDCSFSFRFHCCHVGTPTSNHWMSCFWKKSHQPLKSSGYLWLVSSFPLPKKMGVSKNRGGKPPKRDGLFITEKPMNKRMIWGGPKTPSRWPDLGVRQPRFSMHESSWWHERHGAENQTPRGLFWGPLTFLGCGS